MGLITASVLNQVGDTISTTYSYTATIPAGSPGIIFVQISSIYNDADLASCTIGGVTANKVKIGNQHTQQILFWRDSLSAGSYSVSVTGMAGIHYHAASTLLFQGAQNCVNKLSTYDHAAGAETHSPTLANGAFLLETYCDFSSTDLTLNSGQTRLGTMLINEGSMRVGSDYLRNPGTSPSVSVTWHNADNSYACFELLPYPPSNATAAVFLSDYGVL